MFKSASERVHARSKGKAAVTYGQVMRKRDEEEACLREAEAHNLARSETESEPEPVSDVMRSIRETVARIMAELEAGEKERAKMLAEATARYTSRSKNSDAWLFNAKLRSPNDALAPFVTSDGEVVDGFPETFFGILLLDDESLGNLLRRLELDDGGTKYQVIRRLTSHIGIGVWMREFFEYRLGDDRTALAMTGMAASLKEPPKWEAVCDGLEYFESTS